MHGAGLQRPRRTAQSPGEDGYLETLYTAFENDHVTEHEWRLLSRLHQTLDDPEPIVDLDPDPEPIVDLGPRGGRSSRGSSAPERSSA